MANGHFAQQLIHCLSPVKTECEEVGELHMGSEDGLVVSPAEHIVRPSFVGGFENGARCWPQSLRAREK